MATATRRELLAGMGSLVSIDFEPDNGGIVLSMDENSMRVSAAYPLVNQSRLRFTLRISPEKKVSGTGIVRSVSSTGRSAEMEILEIDADSRTEFDLWMGGTPAESGSPEIPDTAELATPLEQTEALPETPILENGHPALVQDSTGQQTIAESVAAVLPAEARAVEVHEQPPIEDSATVDGPVVSPAPSEAATAAPEPTVSSVAAPSGRAADECAPEASLVHEPRFSSPAPAAATLGPDAGVSMFPILLDGVTDAAANHVAAAVDEAWSVKHAGILGIAPEEPREQVESDFRAASARPGPVERKIPFAPAFPARPTAAPEPEEEDEFSSREPEPEEEPAAIEEPRMAGALYLPNYNVEGITACGTNWHWKERLYSLPLLSLQVAGERFEEFGWSLERDWHIWLALALIAAGFLPLVIKPEFVPATLVLWLIGGRVAIRRRQPERAGERS